MRTNLSVAEEVPSIVVYSTGVPEEILFNCLYGIEEEGIPYRLEERSFTDVAAEAYRAACKSLLEVGVALSAEAVAVHYSRLPPESPMFYQTRETAGVARAFGVNAARMVKGIPFVL